MNRTGLQILLAACACLLFSVPAHSQSPDNWPDFLGPNRDGKSLQTSVRTDWSDGKLRVLWRKPIGESYSAPSVIGDRVYFFDRAQEINVLSCLSVTDGSEIWRFEYQTDYVDLYRYNGGPRCSPVLDDQSVYIYGPEGRLHAVDLQTGKKKWMVDTREEFGVVQNFFGVGSSPVVFEDMLIAMVGGSPATSQDVPAGRLDLVKADNSGIVAFDKRDGSVRYRAGNMLASYASPVVRRFEDQDVVIALMREGLLGIDARSGKELFQTPFRARSLESVNASTPVVEGNRILLTECYGIGGRLLEWDGEIKEVWSDSGNREKRLDAHWNTPIVVDGFAYASCGRHSGNAELRCIELSTGEVQWSQPGLRRATITYVAGHLVVLGEYGELLLIKTNPKKFELVTQYQPDPGPKLKYPCWAAPVVCDGRMFVLTADQLICFQIADD